MPNDLDSILDNWDELQSNERPKGTPAPSTEELGLVEDTAENYRAVQDSDITYYENGRGGVAVSWDNGETLMIAMGRRLPVHETSWEESEDDLYDRLSETQRKALDAAREQTLTPIERLARDHGRMRRHLDRTDRAQPPKEHRQLPETAMVVMSESDKWRER